MRSITAILSAVEAKLTAATWTPSGGSAEPAFATVKRFDSTDLEAALTELTLKDRRVALVVYLGDEYQPDPQSFGGDVTTRRTVKVSVVVSDRVIGDRQSAAWGTATSPGTCQLVEIARNAVAGELIADPEAVDCVPMMSELMDVQNLAKKQPGRKAGVLDLHCIDRIAASTPYA